jgi:hypothetical protein
MGRYPTQAELDEIDRKKKKEKEGPSLVDQMKSEWDEVVAKYGGTYLNASAEAAKRIKTRGK